MLRGGVECKPAVLGRLLGRQPMLRVPGHDCLNEITAILARAVAGKLRIRGEWALVMIISEQLCVVEGRLARDQSDANAPERPHIRFDRIRGLPELLILASWPVKANLGGHVLRGANADGPIRPNPVVGTLADAKVAYLYAPVSIWRPVDDEEVLQVRHMY